MANDHVPFPEDKTGPSLFRKYLEERGISPQTVEQAGLFVASREKALDIINSKFPTQYRHFLVIPYPSSGTRSGASYNTIRGLGDLDGTFQQGLKKTNKLLCPSGPPYVYVPPMIDWDNFDGDLYFCESAIKALVMAQHGYAAIGGNGVYGIYTNSGFSKGYPSELIDGSVKRAIILFDANWQTNAEVQAAIRKLANGINYAHPNLEVYHKQLPLTESGKDQGIDDFFVTEGASVVKEWLACDEVCFTEIEVTDRNKHFDELNERYVITRSHGNIIDRLHRRRVSRTELTEVLEAHRTYIEEVRAGKGVRKVEMSAAREWFKWEKRSMVEKQIYLPGAPELELEEPSFYNTYYDDGVVAESPPPGTSRDAWVAPFLEVYRNAAPDDIERRPLMESVAWMLQNRGTRMKKCFCLIGPDQGTGKSLFCDILGQIFGESNSTSVSAENFGNKFNAGMVGKEVVVLDDLVELKTQSKGLFKNFVTSKNFLAESKGRDAVKSPSTAVLFITSNEFSAIPLDPEDRRVHIIRFAPTVRYEQGSQYWDEFIAWLEDGGVGRVRWWFETMDLEEFNPNFMPPMSATKRHMLQSSMDDVEAWVMALHKDPDAELLGNKRAFYTIDELVMLYVGPAYGSLDDHARNGLTRRMGFHLTKWYSKVGEAAIRTKNGRHRYWGIRQEGTAADMGEVKKDVERCPSLKITD